MTGALIVASWLLMAPPDGGPGQDAAPTGETEAVAAAAEPPDERPAAPSDEEDSKTTTPEGPVAITTRISPDPSNIGDVLELEVTVAYPRGYSVNLPSVLSFDPLHLVSVAESEPEPTGEGLRKVFTIALQYFDVGEARVPAFPLTYVTPDGQVQTVDVPSRSFTVEALLANEADPQRKGEDPPISIAYPNRVAELVIYGVLGLLGALALGWIIGRRLRNRPRVVPAPPPIPPHEVALGALDELQKGGLVEQGRWQDYYLQLTEIAKAYFEGRFGIEALDRTTDEIRRTLIREADRLAPLSATEVVAFLERCDLVKFARFAPELDDARSELERVRTMVRETMSSAGGPEPAAREREGGAGPPEPGGASRPPDAAEAAEPPTSTASGTAAAGGEAAAVEKREEVRP